MNLDVSSTLDEAIAKARAKALAQVEQQAKDEAAARTAKVDSWKQQQAERETVERQARNKAGIDLAEDLIKEIAEPFSRFATRDDAAKFANLKFVLYPGKTDGSPGYSIKLECPGSNPKLWHKATLENLTEVQKRQIEKLQAKGGFFYSSTTEMLEEVIKLRDYISRIEKVVRDVNTEEAGKVRDIIAPLQIPKE